MWNSLMFLLLLTGSVQMEYVPLRPYEATVSSTNSNVVYKISYNGSGDTHVLWEEHYGALYSKDADQASVLNRADGGSSTLTLPGAREDVVVRLAENERSLNGYVIRFRNLSQALKLPEIHVNTNSDVTYYPGGRVYLNVTVVSPIHFERRFVMPTFVGAMRNSTDSKIVIVPSHKHTQGITANEISRAGETFGYEIILPDVEGLLIISSSLSSEGNWEYPALTNILAVSSLPAGHQDLFEESFLGVSVPNKLPNGYCACPSNFRCIIECVAMGTNVDSVELYYENRTRAYTTRQDLRHENKYIQTRFVFDDVSKGEKGRLICEASVGSQTEVESFDMIAYVDARIIEARVDHVGDEMVYRCSATGYPKPVFYFYIDENENIYEMVTATEEEPVNEVYSATYRWSDARKVKVIRCRVISEYTADWSTLNLNDQ